MKRRLPILLALMLAGCQCLQAQSESGKSQVIPLSHKFALDQTVRYKIVQHITGSRAFPGSEKATPIDALVTSVIRIRCIQVSGDGSAGISIEIESGSVKIGKRAANAFAAGSMPRTLHVTPSGKVTFPQQEEQVGDSSTRRVLMDCGAIEPLIILGSLPEQAVALGGSWSADAVLPSSAAVKINSTLQEVRDVSGERGAVIKQTQTSTGDSAARQEAQSTLVFGLDTGWLLSAEGSIHSVNTWTLDSKYTVEMLKG